MSNRPAPLEPEDVPAADARSHADSQSSDSAKQAGSLVERAEIALMVAWIALALSFIGLIATIRIRSTSSESVGNNPPQFRTDINTAPAAELALLPGIGPELAARIVAEREAGGPFTTAEQLSRVRGIGPTKIDQVAPMLTFDDMSTSAIVHDQSDPLPP
jgi:competence ComEA-like helix-hairpin-helix protein